MSVSITLPWPPSVNKTWMPVIRCKKGRRPKPGLILNPKVKEYRSIVEIMALQGQWRKKRMEGPLFLYMTLTPARNGINDIDNRLKTPFDVLKKVGLYEDDSQIHQTFVVKRPAQKPGKVEMTFTEMKEHNEEKCLLCGAKLEQAI
jgi:crossover junction endodeoxyribonuclease RusA